jgi:3-oxoacyl-[acyl-carrier protein] reductase
MNLEWGRIIHLTSQPWEDLTISSTLRVGLSGLTKTMSNELGPDNITVNAILTGQIMTDRQTHLANIRSKERGITHEEYYRQQAAEIPLRRIGEPKELGEVVAFLASALASFITGVLLPFEGFQHDFGFEFGAVCFAFQSFHRCSLEQRFYTLNACPVFGQHYKC